MPHDNHAYFLARERRSREIAAKATDPIVRGVHKEMAEHYAERAHPQPGLAQRF